MGRALFVTGTDTDIGKTTVSKAIVAELRSRKADVVYYKPVQSGGSGDTDEISRLGVDVVNTYTFKEPYSPHYASELESVEVEPGEIISSYRGLRSRSDYLLVEGAGGLIVPLVRNGYYISNMIVDMGIDVLLVTELRVGGINHTLLSYEYLRSIGVDGICIYANRYGDSDYERDNKRIIEEYTGIEVLTELKGAGVIDRLFR